MPEKIAAPLSEKESNDGNPETRILDHLLSSKQVENRSALALSPDGRLLAMTLAGPHEEHLDPETGRSPRLFHLSTAGSHIVVADTRTGELTRPFGKETGSLEPG